MLTFTEQEVQALKNRVSELELQLKEAQATILALTSAKEDKVQARTAQQYEQPQFADEQQNPIADVESFRKAIFVAPYPHMIRRDDGKVLMINKAWTKITGYTLEEIPTIEEWTRKAYGARAPQRQSLILNEGFSQEGLNEWGEAEITTRSGETRIWDFSSAPLGVNENGLRLAMTIAVDITERKQAEEQLAYQAQLLSSVQEAVVATDEEMRITFWNEAAENIFGWKLEEALGQSTAELFQTEIPNSTREQALRSLMETGRYEGEVRYRRKDGFYITAHARSAVLGKAGQFRGLVTSVQDITGQKLAEERFNKAFHARPSALMISRHDDGRIETVNEAFLKLFGYSEEEVIGKTSTELHMFVNPADRQQATHKLEKDKSVRDFELEIRLKSGEIREVNLSIEMMDIGGISTMLTVIQDVTIRKQAERALRESEERFRSLADSMPQLVWTARPDGIVDYYNQRYHEYWEMNRVVNAGWDWSSLLHPDDLQPTLDAWMRSIELGDIYQIEHRVRMADGSYRWHLSRGIPMLDKNGKIKRWFGTGTDIHEQKLAEEKLKRYAEQLERSNRELEQFAFLASHDLQEPLRKIEAFGDALLERATPLSDQDREYLDRMRSAAGRMREMVQGLLQLSRVNTQGKPFVRVDLLQITLGVLGDLEELTQQTGAKIEVGPLPVLDGDSVQLRQMMQNLIGNALKYHPPGKPPQVKIFAKQFAGKVQIFVEDNGIGFQQQDAERIFEPFQRLVNRNQYEGSGMGLAICRRIVERHRGEITALSKPGEGTTFSVTLPVDQPQSAKNTMGMDANNGKPGP